MLQSSVFLDTSYIIALATPKDNHHDRAVKLSAVIAAKSPRLVTSRGVFLEIGNSFSKLKYRTVGIGILAALESDPRIEIVELTPQLYDDAFHLYRQRPDKEWGLTDCLSFAIMRQHDIHQALTADEHFDQAGYEAVLRL